MSHNPNEAEREMEKAIFISADCWLEVFGLLPRSQLGLGIAMIRRRFDRRVDEHFKTRKWTLENQIQIEGEIGKDGTKEMTIINLDEKTLPIPQNPLPNKVIGFKSIEIYFFDHNVLTFLRRFHRFFTTCATKLYIDTENFRISEFAVFNIWSILKDSIHVLYLNTVTFRQMRQLAPSMFNDCQSLRVVNFYDGICPEFPLDDSANASDCQALAKWLFTPCHDNLMKQLFVRIDNSTVEQQWLETVEQIKTAFSIASSSVAFGIFVNFRPSSPIDSVVPFKLTNKLTGEELALSKEENANVFIIRCPIAADDDEKWQNAVMNELTDGNKQIVLFIGDSGVDYGLLDAACFRWAEW